MNFANPNAAPLRLPSTSGYLPPPAELAGGNTTTFQPTQNDVIIGVPTQESGIRPARALPYELNVHASVNESNSSVTLRFINTGRATAVFQVRSADPADTVRDYTVEPGKTLADTWNFTSSYGLKVYAPKALCVSSAEKSALAPHYSMSAPVIRSEIATGTIAIGMTATGTMAPKNAVLPSAGRSPTSRLTRRP